MNSRDDIDVIITYENDKVPYVSDEEADIYVERLIDQYESDGFKVTRIELCAMENGYIDAKVNRKNKHPFERIRRITGYLVGTLNHFNDAKRKEVESRVKHNGSEDLK